MSKRKLWFAFLGFMVLSIGTIAVFSAKKERLKRPLQQRRQTKEWLTSVPAVGSKVKDLEIVNPRIIRAQTDIPAVQFEIVNKSARSVMAIRVICGDDAIAKDGLEDEDNPKVVIEPYGKITAEMTELTEGYPLVIHAATFEDGKEEGDSKSVKFMQKVRTIERAKHKGAQEAARRSKQ